MASWTSGYVAELGYGHDFNAELTPELLRFAGLVRGIRVPDPGAPLSYCELGCGQGFSSNVLAAANPHVAFHAVDFNPAHVATAQALAARVGTPNVCFHELAFADLETDQTLPARFDIIGLHGVYSWISNENRGHIVNFLRRRLRPGGLAYISYNAMPGWAAKMPLRRLMADHAAHREGPLSARIDSAVDFIERLRGVSPSYFTHNPRVMADFDKFKGMARSYLAHEYFNRDLTAFHFADVAADLAEAKLDFVGSVDLLDHIDAIHLSPEQQAFLAEIPDPVNREGLRDLIVEQVFRRDLFVKGAVPHDALSAREAWLDQNFVLSTARDTVELKISGARGEAALQADIYEPILDGFADRARSVRDICSLPAVNRIDWPRLLQAVTVLDGAGSGSR